MKGIILSFVFCLVCSMAFSTRYYFSSNSGNDKNNGTLNSPYRTLDKLKTIWTKKGDSVLFKTNEFFYGSIKVNSNNVYYGTYGGTLPAIISGVSLLKNWQAVGNGVYRSDTFSVQSTLRTVILDNKLASIGRFPNEGTYGGYLAYTSFTNYTGYSTIYSNVPAPYDIDSSYIGADLNVKPYLSTLEKGKITNVSNHYITFDNRNMFYQLMLNNCGYFITNSIKTLDLLGEWFYNTKDKRLYMYFGNEAPVNHTVEVGTQDILIQPNFNNAVIENLVLRGANKYGISSNYASRKGLTINNVKVLKTGIIGIALANCDGISITNSTIEDCNTTGINVGYNCNNKKIVNNKINNIGLIPANLYADSMYQRRMGYGIYSGVSATNGLYAQNNKLENIAFIGIFFTGCYNNISFNYIAHSCLYLDDGGAIYEGGYTRYTGYYLNNNNYIYNNIILDVRGYCFGFPSGGRIIPNAIFIDDNGASTIIKNNYVNGSGQSCLYIHNGNSITASNNVFINAGLALIMMQDNNTGGKVYGNNIQNNQLLIEDSTKTMYCFYGSGQSTDNYLTKFGTIDNNYLMAPNLYSGYNMHLDTTNVFGAVDCTLKTFQIKTPYEHNAKAIDTRYKEIKSFYAVDKDSIVHIPGLWQLPTGEVIQDSIKIKNHTGVILIKIITT